MTNRDSSKVLLVISLLLFTFGTYKIIQDTMTYFWTPVKAEIIQYEVRCCSSRGESESVYVKYEYSYLDKEYFSESISLNYRDINNKGEKSFVKTKKRIYKVGQELPAYISREKSVLEKGIDERVVIVFIFSLLIFLLSRFYSYRSE